MLLHYDQKEQPMREWYFGIIEASLCDDIEYFLKYGRKTMSILCLVCGFWVSKKGILKHSVLHTELHNEFQASIGNIARHCLEQVNK
jgi:lipid-A-disaccharide synthase-like uncharacterized protein